MRWKTVPCRLLPQAGNVPDADHAMNALLAMLPPGEREQFTSAGRFKQFQRGDLLFRAGDPVRKAWFQRSGVISIVTEMESGGTVEAVTVGLEGMVGYPITFGARHSTLTALCQVPAEAFVFEQEAMEQWLLRSPRLAQAVRRYTSILMAFIAQTAGCNRAHPVDERCARWLLLTQDRVRKDEFPLTQEFLAQMLGVHRPSVSVAAKMLQKAGLIDYRHGVVRVLDRQGLEAAACECYAVIREQVEELLHGER